MTIGFIGYSEAAWNLAAGLRDDGFAGGFAAHDLMQDHPDRGPVIHAKAEAAGVSLVDSNEAVARQADILIAAVPSKATLAACGSVAGVLRPDQILADVSSASPRIKSEVWETVRASGVQFCDAAMLGALPIDRNHVSIVASGNGAQAFHDAMTPYGMRIQVVGDRPGDASAIKLIRSVFMKGYAALLYEMLAGGEAYGVSDRVIASIGGMLDKTPFAESIDYHIVSTAIHAKRRGGELDGSIEMLDDRGLRHTMTEAARGWHELLAGYHFADRGIDYDRCGWREIIHALDEPAGE